MSQPRLVTLAYKPRTQFVPFHMRQQRWACVVSHVRAGKTVACLMDLVDAALRCPLPDPRFAYIAPYYAQAKDVAWMYLKRFTADVPGAETNEGELRVDFPNGGRVRLYGADNYNRMRGIYLDGAVLDEPADFHPAAWPEVIRPRLSDRKGWGAFIGTPKGRGNEFFRIREMARLTPAEWFYMELRADQTGILSPDELASAQRDLSEDQYAQEYLCSFDAAIKGAYYAKLLAQARADNRICSVPYDPNYPVYTGWDLGINDATAIWFVQIVAREVRWIDYDESQGRSLIDSAKFVLSKPYVYAEHYLPHDVDTKEMTHAKTRKETLESVGLRPIRPGSKLGPAERINALRQMIPRSVFDERRCNVGLESLINYQVAYDQKNRTPLDRPLHNWASHGADAAGEMAVQLFDAKEFSRHMVAKTTVHPYDPFSVGTPQYRTDLDQMEERITRQHTAGITDYNPF